MGAVEHLFSYGTLRQPEVQRSTFGRQLPTMDDALLGYRLETVMITDQDVVATSGSSEHPILIPTGRDDDLVPGSVLEMTPMDLKAADEYEVEDYQRVSVRLLSGLTAWVYVAANDLH